MREISLFCFPPSTGFVDKACFVPKIFVKLQEQELRPNSSRAQDLWRMIEDQEPNSTSVSF